MQAGRKEVNGNYSGLSLLNSRALQQSQAVDTTSEMMHKRKIQFGAALLLATFYTVPWIALTEQSLFIDSPAIQSSAARRIGFLFISVFFSGLFFFQYNLFWRVTLKRHVSFPNYANYIVNGFLIIVVSYCVIKAADAIFPREHPPTYFIRYLGRNTVIACICLLVGYALDLIRTLEKERLNSINLQKEKLEIELEVLRAQINPHFFFNSLNSLSFLIREDGKKAIEFVNHLSHSFRYILENRQLSVVSVSDELSYLQSYMFMMHQRFNDALRLEIAIEDRIRLKRIPQFALQIVVENAIKHNIMSGSKPLAISILSDSNLIVVRNNVQLRQLKSPGFGIGLANLSRRYLLLNGGQIQVVETSSFFEVKLPLL